MKNNSILIFLLLSTFTLHAAASKESTAKQQAVDSQFIEASSGWIGWVLELINLQSTIEVGEAKRRQSEERPEALEDAGLSLVRTPEERRKFVEAEAQRALIKSWTEKKNS